MVKENDDPNRWQGKPQEKKEIRYEAPPTELSRKRKRLEQGDRRKVDLLRSSVV